MGPQGEKVVSSRAIKHIDELAAIARGDRKGSSRFSSLLLFMIVRSDVVSMRINEESCPSFAKHAKAAQAAGVRIVAHKVRWGTGKDLGRAFWGGQVPVDAVQTEGKPAPKATPTRRARESKTEALQIAERPTPKAAVTQRSRAKQTGAAKTVSNGVAPRAARTRKVRAEGRTPKAALARRGSAKQMEAKTVAKRPSSKAACARNVRAKKA